MIELRGKAVADAHKEILQEKMTGLESGTITMAVVSCVSNYQVQLRIKRYTMH